MVVIKNAISINLTRDKVFNFLRNPITLPLWNYYIKSVQKISAGDEEVGSRFHQVRKNDEQFFFISKLEKNNFLEFKTEPNSSLNFIRQITFSEVDGITQIDDRLCIDTGYPLFLQKLFSVKIKHAVKENLIKLKELLETGKTELQDGRVIVI